MAGRRVIAVTSGKGGVGKTTVAVGLAQGLSRLGYAVGLLDADLYGPDVPRFLGLTRLKEAKHLTVWSKKRPPRPVERYGIKVWSMQFQMAEAQSLSVEASIAGLLVNRALDAVDWGELDWLIVDTPPGTADVLQRLGALKVDAAIIVVTPQDVAHLEARKVLVTLRELGVPVLGGVENMAGMDCPHCGEEIALYPETPTQRSLWADSVDRLGRLTFSSALTARAEAGLPLIADESEEVGRPLRELAQAVVDCYPPGPAPSPPEVE